MSIDGDRAINGDDRSAQAENRWLDEENDRAGAEREEQWEERRLRQPETFARIAKEIDEDIARENRPRVKLSGEDGNAFAIMGACARAWKKAGRDGKSWTAIQLDMMGGDYDHLIQVAMRHFNVT